MSNKGAKSLYVGIWIVRLALIAVYLLFGLKFANGHTWLWYFVTAVILLCIEFLTVYIVDIVHELGHVLVALCCNFQVQKVSLSFFNFDRSQGKTKFYLSNPFHEKMAGESVLIPKADDHLKGKFIAITLGGLLATTLFIVLGIFAIVFYKKLSFWGYVLLAGFAPYAVYQLLLNVVPITIGNLHTDGKILFDFIKGGAEAEILQLLLAIESNLLQGKSPKEIGQSLYASTAVLADDNFYAILYKLQKLYRYLDCDQIDDALAITLRLLQMEEYFPQEHRDKILTELLYVLSLYTDEPVAMHLKEELQEYFMIEDELVVMRTKLVFAAKEVGFMGIEKDWQRAMQRAEVLAIQGVAKLECKLLYDIKREFIEERE